MNTQLQNIRLPFQNYSMTWHKELSSGHSIITHQNEVNATTVSIKNPIWNGGFSQFPKGTGVMGSSKTNMEAQSLRPTTKHASTNASSSNLSHHAFSPFSNKPPHPASDTPKTSEAHYPHSATTTQNLVFNESSSKRTPRMSEPMQLNILPPMLKSKSTQQSVNDSSQQKKFKEPNIFLKTKQTDNPFVEDEKGIANKFQAIQVNNINRQKIWSKTSLGRKRGLVVTDFKKIKQLGAGKYGKVSLVRQRNSGFVCALKMMEKKLIKQQGIIEQFTRELKIQMYLNHPNIIKTYGYFQDHTYIYIILEAGTGGQLFHQIKKSEPMPEPKVATVIKQVCEAVNELHSHRILHRDIKPENIVVHQNVIKLCDFGWSVYLDNKLRSTFCGTPLYVCPQILKGKQYDEKIDIWSLGIMMYQMMVGESPFKITKEEQLIKIVKDEISIPSYVFVSKEARDFMDKCLKKNPNDRSTIKQLLNHDFFSKNQQKKMAL